MLRIPASHLCYRSIGPLIESRRNSNVPRFADSWALHWADRPRHFGCDGVTSGRSGGGSGGGSGTGAPDFLLCSMGTNDGLIASEAGTTEEVRDLVTHWLASVRAAVGAATHVCLCVPFGGFGGASMPPHGALISGFERYQAQCGGDARAHLVDLGADAAIHLTGFRYTKDGRFDATDESADGIHPTLQRHVQLGEMVACVLEPLLTGHLGGAKQPTTEETSSASSPQTAGHPIRDAAP